MKFLGYKQSLKLNGHQITTVRIGQHYAAKHGAYMTDELILELVTGWIQAAIAKICQDET